MDLFINVAVYFLLCFHGLTTCQQWRREYRDYNSPQYFFNDLKTLLQLPGFKYEVSQRTPTNPKDNRPIQPINYSRYEVNWQQKVTKPTTPSSNNQKYDSSKKAQPCADLIGLDCTEQKKLFDSIFKDNPINSSIKNKNGNNGNAKTLIHPRFNTERYISTTTGTIKNYDYSENSGNELETTTDADFGVDDRIQPEILAAFLG